MEVVKDGICKGNPPSERSESIGSNDAFRDLQESTSLDLLRNSIFKSIFSNPLPAKVVEIRDISRNRSKIDFSDITQADIDVKFLEKNCSSLKTKRNEIDEANTLQKPEKSFLESSETCTTLSDVSELIGRHSFEESEEISDGRESLESSANHSINDSLTESQDTLENNRNSLRLAFSVGSDHGIFENCSTYNITCPHDLSLGRENQRDADANMFRRNNLNFKAAKNRFPFLPIKIEDGENSKESMPSTPDDQNSLCDTFFSHVVSGDYVPPGNESNQSNIGKQSIVNSELRQEIPHPIDGDNVSINSIESHSDRKPSRRIRKRNRKGLSKGPFVYECPKCGVSYVVSSKTVGDVACCLHCDLCTSVEPVFMKREKMSWKTCRIC